MNITIDKESLFGIAMAKGSVNGTLQYFLIETVYKGVMTFLIGAL